MLEHHPWFEVAWLAASDRSEGRPYAEAARWRLKTAIPQSRRQHDGFARHPEGAPKIIFAALDAGIARELEPQFAAAGCAVVSNSSALRMQPRPAGHSRSQRRSHRAHRTAVLAQEIRRLHRHQFQLLCHGTGAGSGAAASQVRHSNPSWP
jgi:hypothetical protein